MTAICRITGFLGYTTADDRPAHLRVEAGQAFADDDQVVVSRPDAFDVQPGPATDSAPQEQEAVEPRRGTARPATKRSRGGNG